MRKLILFLVTFLSLSALAIEGTRIQQIQKALRSKGYNVRVSGVMDSNTSVALKDFQKRNKWQHKVIPDSRALTCLGLGPHYNKLLNPETAVVPACAKR